MHPDLGADYAEWSEQAEELIARLDGLRAQRDALRADAQEDSAGALRFDSDEQRWWYEQLSDLVRGLEELADPQHGIFHGTSPQDGPGIEQRRADAERLHESTLGSAAARAAWEAARERIRSHAEYEGLELAPQYGLLPLGPDPLSGLEEFAHLPSGSAAQRDAQGRLAIEEQTGIVLVLLPGGHPTLGAQSVDPGQPNYDALARRDESDAGRLDRVHLDPFFLGKYEVTQAQWERLGGSNPSSFTPAPPVVADLTHPVEHVSWLDCQEVVVRRMGLALPTEAQWEYACRAGSEGPWCSGEERAALAAYANLCDLSFVQILMLFDWKEESWSDGFPLHAPVGSFEANRLGLHDLHGNVWEWCEDRYLPYSTPAQPGSGLREGEPVGKRVFRGGSFFYAAGTARSAFRYSYQPEFARHNLGVRPARSIEPAP